MLDIATWLSLYIRSFCQSADFISVQEKYIMGHLCAFCFECGQNVKVGEQLQTQHMMLHSCRVN